jgi:hypothetical protein
VGKIGVHSSGTVRDLHPIPFSGISIANGMRTVEVAKVIEKISNLQTKDVNIRC